MDAEVRERREVLLVDRVPEPELGGDPPVEVAEHVEAVGALGRRGQAEQLDGLQVVEQRLVRRCGGVVELVDDHDVEVCRVDAPDVGAVEALDRREDVLEPRRAVAADPHLAEGRVAQRMPERRPALVEDLLAMRDEQEPTREASSLPQTRVVDCRHHRLARAGGGDEQIAVVSLVTRELDAVRAARSWKGRSSISIGLSSVTSSPVVACVRRLNSSGSYGDEVAALPVARRRRLPSSRPRPGCGRPTTRTFHSSPMTCAECVRFDEPMYAVE